MDEQNKAQSTPARRPARDRWIKLGFVLVAGAIVIYLVRSHRGPLLEGWGKDLDKALEQGRKENRRIVVFFMSRPPGDTDRWLKEKILGKAGNRKALEDGKFIRVQAQVDTDLKSELAARYKLRELPTFMVLDPQGKELNRREGKIGELDFRNGFLDCTIIQY